MSRFSYVVVAVASSVLCATAWAAPAPTGCVQTLLPNISVSSKRLLKYNIGGPQRLGADFLGIISQDGNYKQIYPQYGPSFGGMMPNPCGEGVHLSCVGLYLKRVPNRAFLIKQDNATAPVECHGSNVDPTDPGARSKWVFGDATPPAGEPFCDYSTRMNSVNIGGREYQQFAAVNSTSGCLNPEPAVVDMETCRVIALGSYMLFYNYSESNATVPPNTWDLPEECYKEISSDPHPPIGMVSDLFWRSLNGKV